MENPGRLPIRKASISSFVVRRLDRRASPRWTTSIGRSLSRAARRVIPL